MPRRVTFALPLLLVLGILVPTVVAGAQQVPACRPAGESGGLSKNVEHLCNIPDTAMISLVFAQTGNFFYASSTDTTSVYSYDIDAAGVPSNITLRSTVATPQFENESVTYGERRDAAGNVTARFVILAEDTVTGSAPRDPSFHLGGNNVVIIDVTDPDNAFVRSTAEIPTNTHTVQCVTETQCTHAYSVGSGGVFSVIDLTDLDDITVSEPLAEVPSPAGGPNAVFTSGAGHDWWFDEAGIGWHTGSGGMAAFDATDPTNPVLLNQTDESGITSPLNDFILHNAVRPHASAYSDEREANEPNLAKGNVVLVTEEDYLNDGNEVDCTEAGLFETWYVPSLDGSDVKPAAQAEPGGGSIRNLDSINAPRELGLPAGLFCSAHWFDYNDKGFIAQGWYQGGLHVLDVRDPADIKVHAYSFLGASEVWDAYWFPKRDAQGRQTGASYDTVITADFVRGLDVYRIQGLPDERIQEVPLPGDDGQLPPGAASVTRVAGEDRVETAVKASKAAFGAADTAVLARADAFPDALAGASLAAEADAPILLTAGDGLDGRVAAELERLGVEHAYLLGGTDALSARVESDVQALGIATTRLGGADRFATAVEIAEQVVELGGPVAHVAVALGARGDGRDAFPDALGASNLAMNLRVPILLTRPGAVPEVTLDAVERLAGGAETFVIGGPVAISESAEDQLRALGPVQRLAGATRYGTAVEVLAHARAQDPDLDLTPLFLASGEVFPDALAAAPAVFHLGGALLLVHATDLDASAATRDHLARHADEIGSVVIVGGEVAVTRAVREQVAATVGA